MGVASETRTPELKSTIELLGIFCPGPLWHCSMLVNSIPIQYFRGQSFPAKMHLHSTHCFGSDAWWSPKSHKIVHAKSMITFWIKIKITLFHLSLLFIIIWGICLSLRVIMRKSLKPLLSSTKRHNQIMWVVSNIRADFVQSKCCDVVRNGREIDWDQVKRLTDNLTVSERHKCETKCYLVHKVCIIVRISHAPLDWNEWKYVLNLIPCRMRSAWELEDACRGEEEVEPLAVDLKSKVCCRVHYILIRSGPR